MIETRMTDAYFCIDCFVSSACPTACPNCSTKTTAELSGIKFSDAVCHPILVKLQGSNNLNPEIILIK